MNPKTAFSLAASGSTLESIRQEASRFFMGSVTAIPVADHEWKLVRTHNGFAIQGARIVRKKSRFRFEIAA